MTNMAGLRNRNSTVIEAVDDVSSPDTSESDEREGLHASK